MKAPPSARKLVALLDKKSPKNRSDPKSLETSEALKPLKKAPRHSSHLLKQGQSSTGLAYDLVLVRIQIYEFKSVAVARVTAHNSSYPDRTPRNGH